MYNETSFSIILLQVLNRGKGTISISIMNLIIIKDMTYIIINSQ